MKLTRRDFLGFVAGGTVGGAVATATGLTYYYKVVKWRPGKPRLAPEPSDGGWILSQEDLDAFAEADRLVESDTLTMLDNADIPGSGDYKSMRVRNLGECVTACEEDSQCQAFTYARSTHELPRKRQMCWLKENKPEEERIVTDLLTYVSGQR